MKELSLLDLMNRFPDQDSARVWMEEQRWGKDRLPDSCPVCGAADKKITKLKNPGYFLCNECDARFTVRTGTVMERSHISLNKWIIAIYLFVSSRKGISSVHLANMVGVTQKSAWFMLQRIREAVDNNDLGMFSGIVEADETYVGGLEKNKHDSRKNKDGRGSSGKTPVVGVRSRAGKVRGKVVKNTDTTTIQNFLNNNLQKDTHVISDEFPSYKKWSNHSSVNHSTGQYVNDMIHTNGIESVWSVLKRGIIGVYYSVSVKHLKRYVNEFTFRLSRCTQTLETQLENTFIALIGTRIQYREVAV